MGKLASLWPGSLGWLITALPLYVVNERPNGGRAWGMLSEQQSQFSVQGEPPSLCSILSSLSPCAVHTVVKCGMFIDLGRLETFLAGMVKTPRTRGPQRTLSLLPLQKTTHRKPRENKTMRVLRTRMEANPRLLHIPNCEASLNPLRVPRQPYWLLRLLLPASPFEIHRNFIPNCYLLRCASCQASWPV